MMREITPHPVILRHALIGTPDALAPMQALS